MKKIICLLSALFSLTLLYADSDLTKLRHNPWELIIYRPENKEDFNYVRCYLRIEDKNGNDVSKTKVKATYEWATIPNIVNHYKNQPFLDGGMAMHLNLKPGKYRFSVYTPPERQKGFKVTEGIANKNQWESNVFEYDTENPAKVIFVTPVINDNGFYTGEWHIDFKAPRFFKWSEGKIKISN
ncbi:hypothetical protein [uncultured Treponema sp.]|uniref:hypothetical protein n=1 Tax=uncultured Treponema sp. TaxID=162155 RepID=UPI0025F0C5CA|nr:hypothetical protein [uncultured Treponema sp.]